MEHHHHDHDHDDHQGHDHHGHDRHGQATPADEAAMAEMVDLDAEVLHSYLSELVDWVHDLAADQPRRRILDLGSGTGTGALALVQRFAEAEVTAVDVSASMLARIQGKADALGLADRVHTLQADLDSPWPAIDAVDLVWASASLHHLADPDRVLADVFNAMPSGGLLVVAELDSFPRFLPDDLGLGRPGLEDRCYAAMAEARAETLPYMGSDWGPRLSRAGFKIEAERPFTIELKPPLPAATGRYAQACLRRVRSGLGDRLSADDLATLDTLTSDGLDGVQYRHDLTVRAARIVWVGRRP
jgi:SAM-dependent methyltransferase